MIEGVVERLVQSHYPEYNESLHLERNSNLGRIAIELENLGINDPLSHLFQYIKRGEDALTGIMEDLETEITERLPETPFVNQVKFRSTDNDFLSFHGRVSMREMTRNNLNILAEILPKNPNLKQEYERALIECGEVEKLVAWFSGAKRGSFLIFESLPIGDQKVAVTRIYKKLDDDALEGSFMSLYQPTVELFNKLRRQIGVGGDDCKTELDVLDNNYEFFSSTFREASDFIEYYVDVYDMILGSGDDRRHSFGLEVEEKFSNFGSSMEVVKSQPGLTKIYADTLRAIELGRGVVNNELITLARKLDLDLDLDEGEPLSLELARSLLRQVTIGIARVIHQAEQSILTDLANLSPESNVHYDAVSHYSQQSSAQANSYNNNVCPTYNRDTTKSGSINEDSKLEYGTLARYFNVYNVDNFGQPRIGVCIIKGCPSRGDIGWLPGKTIVGGCSICTRCHKIFNSGKSPEKLYAREKVVLNKNKKVSS